MSIPLVSSKGTTLQSLILPENIKRRCLNSCKVLTAFPINVRSIRNKFDGVMLLLNELYLMFDIRFSETWLQVEDAEDNAFDIPGNTYYVLHRHERQGGGISLSFIDSI